MSVPAIYENDVPGIGVPGRNLRRLVNAYNLDNYKPYQDVDFPD